ALATAGNSDAFVKAAFLPLSPSIQTIPDRRHVSHLRIIFCGLFVGGALKAANAFEGIRRLFAFPDCARARLSAAGWAVVIGTGYFLASRLGLSLLVPPSDVAVFWPASGIGAPTFTPTRPNPGFHLIPTPSFYLYCCG